MSQRMIRVSKLLSLVLRHKPEDIGIALDSQGWVSVPTLLNALAANGHAILPEELEQVVRENDKQRFTIRDGRIRANQGHSVEVFLSLNAATPPDSLYHGTATRFLTSILQSGLQKMNRHHVHLSADKIMAQKVGTRHGKPVILKVDAVKMSQDGQLFFLSDNGVWLTDSVSPQYLQVLSDE
ncbi:MAG: RNA 2'-phosphotransferase [Cyanobacteria bacterium P01_H01_bin.15]